MRKLVLAAALFALAPALASAQSSTKPPIAYPNAVGNYSSPGVVSSFLDANGKAVPISAANPVPVASSGSSSTNQGTPASTANSWPMMITDGVNGPADVATSGADGVASVPLFGVYNQNMLWNGSTLSIQRDVAGASLATGFGVSAAAVRPTSSANAAIAPIATAAAASSLVLKASAGNLYSVYAANQTATPGFLVVLNSVSAPADGPITPLECAALPANGNAEIKYNPGPAARFSTGIVAVMTSGADCFTKTTGTITGFIRGAIQ